MAWLRENLLIWAPHALPYLMATVLIGLFITWYTKRKQMVAMIEKIPGPPAWPIIGNALDINVEPREVFICINALVSIGDPMARVWLGPRPMVVTSTCKQAEIQHC
ncbi:cytochrome P450 4c3-like isoform X2 [Palaemon carinicauda]|uniref:cytochrome P450 4c3-like isoform X2 n=1 Tax=Palaemon carinicauda TaxID=392227 RepID=UPI0035B63F1B